MKKVNIYEFLRKCLFKLFTLISIKLPLWKEDKYIEVFPPLLSLPVSLPVNYDMLPDGFAAQFIKVKSIPARRIFTLKDIFISGGPAVFKNFRAFVPSLAWLRHIKHFRKGELLLKQWASNIESISTKQAVALVYDHWSAYNYYHWMAEALPRLLILQKEFPDCLLLIPDPATEYMTITVKALGFTNLHPLNKDWRKVVKVSNLVLPELVYYKNEEKDVLVVDQKKLHLKQPATTPFFNHRQGELIVEVRRRLLELIPDKPRPLKRTYISRSKQKIRQLVNEEEVLVMLKKYQFEILFFEGMPFLEQMKVMLSTALFVSLHGANMVNILFMQQGSKVIEMMNKDYMNDAYYLMASSINIPYYSVPCTMANKNIKLTDDLIVLNCADVRVDVQNLEKVINLALA